MLGDHALGEDLQPRVHKLRMIVPKDKDGPADKDQQELLLRARLLTDEDISFMSNHPIHAILHVCQASRAQYLLRTGATFAFETFVNFNTDTIHLPYSLYMRTSGPETPVMKFLRDNSVHFIQRLAMPRNLLYFIPLRENFLQGLSLLRTAMPLCDEVLLVFFDEYDKGRGFDETWNLKERLVKFSARQQRNHSTVRMMRIKCRSLRRTETIIGAVPINYQYASWECGTTEIVEEVRASPELIMWTS